MEREYREKNEIEISENYCTMLLVCANYYNRDICAMKLARQRIPSTLGCLYHHSSYSSRQCHDGSSLRKQTSSHNRCLRKIRCKATAGRWEIVCLLYFCFTITKLLNNSECHLAILRAFVNTLCTKYEWEWFSLKVAYILFLVQSTRIHTKLSFFCTLFYGIAAYKQTNTNCQYFTINRIFFKIFISIGCAHNIWFAYIANHKSIFRTLMYILQCVQMGERRTMPKSLNHFIEIIVPS